MIRTDPLTPHHYFNTPPRTNLQWHVCPQTHRSHISMLACLVVERLHGDSVVVVVVGGMGGLEVEGGGRVFTPRGAVILGGKGWMVCHNVLRRTETVFRETPPSGRPSRWKPSPPSRHPGADQQPINTQFSLEKRSRVWLNSSGGCRKWTFPNSQFAWISMRKVARPSVIGITSATKMSSGFLITCLP